MVVKVLQVVREVLLARPRWCPPGTGERELVAVNAAAAAHGRER